MLRLLDLNTSDIQEYLDLGLMDDVIDVDFWKRSNKESQELILKRLKDDNEIIKALYYSPHELSMRDMEEIISTIKPHILPLLYELLESNRVRICNIHESLDPHKLVPQYFHKHIDYSSEYPNLLSIMKYTVYEQSELDEVIRLHKLGLGSVELDYDTCDMDVIRLLYKEGIVVKDIDKICCCSNTKELIELLDMGYKPSELTIYIGDNDINDQVTYERCRPYLSSSNIVKACLILGLPLPIEPLNNRPSLTFDSIQQLEEYSKRHDLQTLNMSIEYDGEYCMSPLFNEYVMTIKDINLANWIKELYPKAPILYNSYAWDKYILPPKEYHVKGARRIIPYIYKNIRLLKYYIDYYSDKIDIAIPDNHEFFINC